MSEAAREALRRAAMTARAENERELTVERVLLAILDGADPAATAVVESATTVDDLRAAVTALLPEGTTAG